MKTLLKSFLIGLMFIPATFAFATVTSWDYTSGVLQPLQSMWNAQVKARYFTASSTVDVNTFPRQSSTYSSTTNMTVLGKYFDVNNSAGTKGMVLLSNATNTTWVATSTLFSSFGTVSSVGMTVPTGFTISGSPVTTTGTLGLLMDTGYFVPTTTRASTWDSAYSWGNHSLAGYLTTVDISANTNLTADGTEIVLTGDALSLGNALTFTTGTSSTAFQTALLGVGSDYISDITGTGLSITNGVLSVSGVAGDGVSNWSYNGSRLSPTTTVGIGVFASSTIGNGTATGGLTISGNASTTNLKVTALTASRVSCTDANNLFTTSCTSAYFTSSLSDETGTGIAVFATNPALAGFRSTASSTIGGGTGATGLTINGTATTTDLKVTSLTASRLIATAADKIMSAVSTLTSWIAGTSNEITVTDDGDGSVTLSLPSTIDLGGKTSFEIPNGTNPTFSATGTLAYDETAKQLLIGTSTSPTPRVIRTEEEIYLFSVPSTSPTFATGTTKYLPRISDGYTITEIWCGVEGGTSKAITIIGSTLTCTTGAGASTASPTIPTVGAGSTTAAIVAGNTVGVVNWLNVSVRAIYTRQ